MSAPPVVVCRSTKDSCAACSPNSGLPPVPGTAKGLMS